MKEGWIDMSVLKKDAKVNRAAMESGIMFDADDNTNMALITTKQFGARIGMGNDKESRMDNDEGFKESTTAEGFQRHVERA